jgi:hypothetical protein
MPSVKLLVPAAVLLVLALLAVAGTASANDVARTGEEISLYAPPSTHPAGAPFFVAQSFSCENAFPCLDPTTRFVLSVDGDETYSILDLELDHGVPASKVDVSNFRFGLPAGLHTFHGERYVQGVLVQVRDATVQVTP